MTAPSIELRKHWHPEAEDMGQAVKRLQLLICRLRYSGFDYDADIIEFEILPFLQKPAQP